MNITYSLYLDPPGGGGGLFISGPFEGGGLIGEKGVNWGGGGALFKRGEGLFIHPKTSNGDYLFELQ